MRQNKSVAYLKHNCSKETLHSSRKKWETDNLISRDGSRLFCTNSQIRYMPGKSIWLKCTDVNWSKLEKTSQKARFREVRHNTSRSPPLVRSQHALRAWVPKSNPRHITAAILWRAVILASTITKKIIRAVMWSKCTMDEFPTPYVQRKAATAAHVRFSIQCLWDESTKDCLSAGGFFWFEVGLLSVRLSWLPLGYGWKSFTCFFFLKTPWL